jgi:HEPN domain-containing protein
MDKAEEFKQWFEIAQQDYATAEHCMTEMYPAPLAIICFHCQQSVEKDLKGYLVVHDENPPKIHDLVELCKLCEVIEPKFSQFMLTCSDLTQFGVVLRYPTEIQINTDDVSRLLRYAKEIKAFVSKKISEETKENLEVDNL